MHRLVVVVSTLLVLVGLGLSAYPWVTDVWARLTQNSLRGDLAANARDYKLGLLHDGAALMRLRVPRLDIDVMVVEGTSDAVLRAGAGHYRASALPEQEGNVALAGHRTTYGRPFNRIDELRPGDKIHVTTPLGRYLYTVTRAPWSVVPTDWAPVRDYPNDGSWLTLMSCHPEGSASYRIVARARLTRSIDRALVSTAR